jgi:hypothetical protein
VARLTALVERNPHRSGVCFASNRSTVQPSTLQRETPTGVGCALRPNLAWVTAPGLFGETPTEVGCALRVLDNFDCGGGQGSGRQKNPHRSGEVFARPAGGSAWKKP